MIVRLVNFVTSNKGKAVTLQNKLGEGFAVTQINLELVEPQADSVEEIVKIKAKEAYKYINSTIGIEGLLKLMTGIEDRSCYFVGSVCLQNETGQKVFSNKSGKCEIAQSIQGELPPTAWSTLWQIVIPLWAEGKTFAEVGEAGMKSREQTSNSKSEMDQLVDYLKSL